MHGFRFVLPGTQTNPPCAASTSNETSSNSGRSIGGIFSAVDVHACLNAKRRRNHHVQEIPLGRCILIRARHRWSPADEILSSSKPLSMLRAHRGLRARSCKRIDGDRVRFSLSLSLSLSVWSTRCGFSHRAGQHEPYLPWLAFFVSWSAPVLHTRSNTRRARNRSLVVWPMVLTLSRLYLHVHAEANVGVRAQRGRRLYAWTRRETEGWTLNVKEKRARDSRRARLPSVSGEMSFVTKVLWRTDEQNGRLDPFDTSISTRASSITGRRNPFRSNQTRQGRPTGESRQGQSLYVFVRLTFNKSALHRSTVLRARDFRRKLVTVTEQLAVSRPVWHFDCWGRERERERENKSRRRQRY